MCPGTGLETLYFNVYKPVWFIMPNVIVWFWIQNARVRTSINGCKVHFRFLLTLLDGCQAEQVRKKYIHLLPIYYLIVSREEISHIDKSSNKKYFPVDSKGLKLLAVCYCRPCPCERNVPTFPLNGIRPKLKRRAISSMVTDSI